LLDQGDQPVLVAQARRPAVLRQRGSGRSRESARSTRLASAAASTRPRSTQGPGPSRPRSRWSSWGHR
jgi:hypothetical protein